MNHGKPSLIISVLVDDLVILAEHNVTVEWFHTEFSNIYKVSQFEKIKVYNGIHVHRLEKHCYTLSQEYSIAQFLAKCPVQDINACDSPLLPSDTFGQLNGFTPSFQTPTKYRNLNCICV